MRPILAFLLGFLVIFSPNSFGQADESKFEEIWKLIRDKYVAATPNTSEAKADCLSKFLKSRLSECLDKYSEYLEKENFENLTDGIIGVSTINAEKVEIQSVFSGDLGDNIIYLKVTDFSEKSGDQFLKSIRKPFIESQGKKFFLIDLRDNPGGSLKIVEMISYLFAENPNDIVITEINRDGEKVTRVRDIKSLFGKGPDFYLGSLKNMKFGFLIDGLTASSAEFFVALMSDWGKSQFIIGEKSVGKNAIQSLFPLKGGGGLKLTTKKYLVGNHKIDVGSKIKPTYEVKSNGLYTTGSIDPQNGEVIIDLKNDTQLKFALEKISKK